MDYAPWIVGVRSPTAVSAGGTLKPVAGWLGDMDVTLVKVQVIKKKNAQKNESMKKRQTQRATQACFHVEADSEGGAAVEFGSDHKVL